MTSNKDDLFDAIAAGTLDECYEALSNFDNFDFDNDEMEELKNIFLPHLLVKTRTYVLTLPDSQLKFAKSTKKNFWKFKNAVLNTDNVIIKDITEKLDSIWNLVDSGIDFQWHLYNFNGFDKRRKEYFTFDNTVSKNLILNIVSRPSADKSSGCVHLVEFKNELEYFWHYIYQGSIVTTAKTLLSLAEMLHFEASSNETDFEKQRPLFATIVLRRDENYFILEQKNDFAEKSLEKVDFENEYDILTNYCYRVCSHRLEENNDMFVFYETPIEAFEKSSEKNDILNPVYLEYQTAVWKEDSPVCPKDAFSIAVKCILGGINTVGIYSSSVQRHKKYNVKNIEKLSNLSLNKILAKLDRTLSELIEEYNTYENSEYVVNVKNGNAFLSPVPQIIPINQSDTSDFKQNLTGYVYQLKLLLLFLWRGFENKCYKIQLEPENAEKFDDVAFYFEKNGVEYVRYLQAKYSRFENAKLKYSDFVSDFNKARYSFKKYFISYRKIKQRKDRCEIEDLIFCTNLSFGQLELKNNATNTLQFVEILNSKKDDIFYDSIHKNEWKKYQLKDVKTCPELEKKLQECTNLNLLAKELTVCFIKDTNVLNLNNKNFWVSAYLNVLFKEKIIEEREVYRFAKEIPASQNMLPKVKKETIKKFRREFDELIIKETGTTMSQSELQNLQFESNFMVALMNKKGKDSATTEETVEILVNHILRKSNKVPDKSFDMLKDVIKVKSEFAFNTKFIEERNLDTNTFGSILQKTCKAAIINNLRRFSFFASNAMESLKQYESVSIDVSANDETGKHILAQKLVDHLMYKKTLHDAFKPEYKFLKDVFELTNINAFQFTKSLVKNSDHRGFRDIFLEIYYREKLKSVQLKFKADISKFKFLALKMKKLYEASTKKNDKILKFDKTVLETVDGLFEVLNCTVFVATNEKNKIKFRPSFFTTSSFENVWAQKFKEVLLDTKYKGNKKKKRFSQREFEDLKNYKIEYENFPPYFDTLEENGDINDEIEEFRKLFVIVNTPNETDLMNNVAKELGETFNLLDTDMLTNHLFQEILNWAKEKRGHMLNEMDALKFKQTIKNEISSNLYESWGNQYFKNMEEYNINFNKPLRALQDFLESSGTGASQPQILILETSEILLTTIKVAQTLKMFEKYKKAGSLLFNPLSFLLKMEEHVLNTFGSWETNLLVTVDKQTKEDIKHFCDNLINTIKEKSEKKIVIITPVITDNSNEGDLSMSTIFTELKADYVKNERDKTEFTDLKQNSQKTIIETAEINFQGSKMKLNELIDENVLSTLIDAKTLQKIIEGEEIIIGKPLESVTESECYVRRKIRLIKVSDRIFGESELLNKDLFVLQGTDAKKLLQKKTVEKEQIIDANYFIHNELCDVKKLFIVLQNYKAKTQFSQIVKKYPNHCVHWLITESNTLFWFYSHVPPSVSLKTFGTYVYRDEEYIEESFFYEYVKQNQTVIIADIAGMGKSTILTSFAKALQNNKRWKIRINLNQYMTILANIKEKFSHMEISEVEILKKGLNLNFDNFKSDYEKLILESIIASETHTNIIQTFENRLFSYFFAKRGILYIFDGFDEISPNYGKIVLQLLQMLRQNDKNRIWITSRTHFKEMLEYKFNTFAYDMKPFDRNDQAIFLKEYWINNYRNEKGIEMPNQDRLPLYIEKLLDEASQIIGDIIGITLQTKMLAEIFQENHDDENDQNSWISCFEYADNISQEVNISSKLANVFSLFENFFREKVIKYFSNENGFTHLKKPLAKKAKKYTLSAGFAVHKVYGYLALIGQNEEETLLSDNEKKTKKELTIDFQNIIKNIGIIGSFNSDGYPLFNHLTYAEYFAACFLIDKLCTSPSHAEQIFKVANEIFKKDVPVFVECLKYKLKQKLDNKVLETGLNNKTVLKFVTENGFLNCVHVFLNSKGFDDDFPGDDIQFGSNILNYAAEYGHANVVIYIILRFSKLITQLTDITNHPSGLFHYLCKLIYNGKIKTIISPNKLITQLFEKIKVVAEHDIKPKKDIEMEEIMRYNSLQNCAKISNADEAMSKIEFSNFYSHILNRLSFYSIMMFLDVSKSHSDQYHRPPSNEYMNFIEVVCTKSDMNDTEKLEIFKRFDDTTKAWKITAKIFQQIAAYGYLTLLQMLLECNDFDISYETYFQCFSGACRSDNLEIVKLILPYLEKDPHCYNFGNLLNEALFHVTKLDIIKYVTEGKQNIINNALNKNDETALILAVKKKYNIQTVKYLVKEGADPNKTNKSGESSWTLAIKENRTDIIKCFTDNNLYPKDKSSKEYLNNFTMVDEDHDKMISIYYDDRKTNLKKMKMLLYKYNNDLNVAAKDFEILNLLVKDFECAMYFLQNGVIIQSLYNEVCFRKPRGTGNVRILKYISILHEFTEYIKCREYTPESIIKYYDHYVTKTLNYLYPTNDKNAVGKIIAAVRLEIEDKNVGRVEVKTLLEIAQNANEKILIDWLQSITEAVNKFETK